MVDTSSNWCRFSGLPKEMENVKHAYRRVVTVLVLGSTVLSDHLVLELTVRTYRDDQSIALMIREYSVVNNLSTIQRKLHWLLKPVRVCEVDSELPCDQRLMATTIEWDVRVPLGSVIATLTGSS